MLNTNYLEQNVETLCKNAVKATFMGYRVWFLNAPRALFSAECGRYLAGREATDFAVIWETSNIHEVFLSLRSNGPVDVFSVAKLLGGTGDATAAEARMFMDTFRTAVRLDEPFCE